MANFTAPTAAFPGFPTASAVVVGTATLAVTLPMLTVAATGSSPHGSVNAVLPMLTAVGYSAAISSNILPSITAYGTGRTSHNDLNASLPALTATGFVGANASVSLPSLALSVAGTAWGVGQASVDLPSITVAATATVAGTGQGAATLPMFSVIGYSGSVLSATFGGLSVTASGTTGAIGGAAVTLPMFDVVATATQQNHGGANITLPALVAAPTGKAWLVLPGFTLTAIGTATVTATYEAYALNLNHGRPDATDEMTRYTNFPFTHIVRYKNSYYGANSTGLYLLEGTTDNGTPIEWSFKTGMSDFDSSKLKTVTYAYFGGRLGPSATVSIYPGEPSGTSYSYKTPIGQTAQNYRQQFGRGLSARYFAIGASGNEVLELDSLDLTTVNLTRRI